MNGYYGVKINGFDSWQWRVDRSVIPKDFGYKRFVEERVIPFAKLIIRRIKEVNPNLEVIWKDTRKNTDKNPDTKIPAVLMVWFSYVKIEIIPTQQKFIYIGLHFSARG